MFATTLRMSRSAALQRTKQLGRHMASGSASAAMIPESPEPPVLWESNMGARTYILNRPKKLNALDNSMITSLGSLSREWNSSELCRLIIGRANGRAFCAGGDVADAIMNVSNEETRHHAFQFFKNEYELDYTLATTTKPYVAFCDGITMGGGIGLIGHAPFRIASERTAMAMPEVKIGFAPDVGANHFLSRLDGQIGTYLALTGNSLRGRAAFLHGLATHFVPSRRFPQLLAQLSSLENPSYDAVNNTIEEHYEEPQSVESEYDDWIRGDIRVALDKAFSYNTVEEIVADLTEISESDRQSEKVSKWAKLVLADLDMRSPTSLKIALEAIRRGASMNLAEVLQMDMNIVTAYFNGASPDFTTGVRTVVVNKDKKNRPAWSPNALTDVPKEKIVSDFFNPESTFLADAPKLELPKDVSPANNMEFALPSEKEIAVVIQGTHRTSGAFGLSLEELISTFIQITSNKQGVREKLTEVVSRCCEVAEDPDNHRHLRWKA